MQQRQRNTILRLAFRGSVLFLVLAWFVHAKLSAPSVELPRNPRTFAGRLANDAGLSEAQVVRVLDKLGSAMAGEMNKNRQVILPGLGRFQPKFSKAWFEHNPSTGELRAVPVSRHVEFQPSSGFVDRINQSEPAP